MEHIKATKYKDTKRKPIKIGDQVNVQIRNGHKFTGIVEKQFSRIGIETPAGFLLFCKCYKDNYPNISEFGTRYRYATFTIC